MRRYRIRQLPSCQPRKSRRTRTPSTGARATTSLLVLPPELGKLTKLTQLLLDDNDFTGQLPSELGNIAGLQHLFVRDSRLTGEIPAWLASLDDLEYLYLEGNDFTGCIPAGLRDVQNNDLDSLELAYCSPAQ